MGAMGLWLRTSRLRKWWMALWLAGLLLSCRLPYEAGRELAALIGTATLTLPAYPEIGIEPTTPPDPGSQPPDLPQTPAAPDNYPPPDGALQTPIDPGVSSGAPGTPPLSTAGVLQEPPETPGLEDQTVPVVPTPTPFLTATPTFTITPTPTQTPLPPPPWVAAPLKETDPRTVKLASGKVQLIEFFAYWSGSSQAMAPVVQGVEAEYRSQVNFAYLDIDNPDAGPLMDTLGFEAEPHFFLLAPDGKVIQEWVGTVPLAALRSGIEAAIAR